ncbi:MAG: class I tRNA ligase family protein, partial [Planctomycetaceae bacterium]|nr:class I tRNA ligase family protein [Planctomycetaceae bacterium]
DQDKLAAYQTLHEVLVTVTKLIAPMVPFIAERMYQNLVRSWDISAPESVHLCDYPEPNPAEIDLQLNLRASTAQTVVRMALKLREDNSLRVRQPLAELQYACDAPELAAAIDSLTDVIKDELNVKRLTGRDNLDDLVHYSYKPNLKTLGPKYGKLLGVIKKHLPNLESATLDPLRKGESVTLNLDDNEITLEPDDVLVAVEQASDWVTAGDKGIQIALSTILTPELEREGMARDFVRQVQQLRKEANLEIQDRIRISYASDEAELQNAVAEWSDYIKSETLADSIEQSTTVPPDTSKASIGSLKIAIWIEKAK